MRAFHLPPNALAVALAVVLGGLVPTAGADAQTLEITPFAGTRWGGEFEVREFDELGAFDIPLDIDDGGSYGLLVGLGLSRNVQLELGFSRQETELQLDGGFLAPETFLTDVDVDYWHLGVLHQWAPGQVKPFGVISLGATTFDPVDLEFPDETRFSVGLGAGLKVMLQRHLGVRLEGRYFTTPIDEEDELVCDRFGFCFEDSTIDDQMEQFELRGGVIFAF